MFFYVFVMWESALFFFGINLYPLCQRCFKSRTKNYQNNSREAEFLNVNFFLYFALISLWKGPDPSVFFRPNDDLC